MTSYQIKVVNKSSTDKDFFFFTAPPGIGATGDLKIYTNTWVAATGSPNEAIIVSTALDFYAWCGPPLSKAGSKTTVTQGVPAGPVTLGVKGGKAGSTFATQYIRSKKHFEFGPSPTPSAEAGCFEINTGNDFTSTDGLLIGMAMDDPTGGDVPIPVAAIPADPGMNYNIAPVVTFYVAVGSMSVGDVIDYQEISATAGCYDFSPTGAGYGMYYGEIEYRADGTWSTPVYNSTSLTEPAGSDWLNAIVSLAIPIVTAALQEAIKSAIKKALANLNYTVGSLTFTSNGDSITVTYKLPFAQEVIVKPFSEISVSLDAKNEILKIKFSPISSDNTLSTAQGPSQQVVIAITNAVNSVPNLPAGEKVTGVS